MQHIASSLSGHLLEVPHIDTHTLSGFEASRRLQSCGEINEPDAIEKVCKVCPTQSGGQELQWKKLPLLLVSAKKQHTNLAQCFPCQNQITIQSVCWIKLDYFQV